MKPFIRVDEFGKGGYQHKLGRLENFLSREYDVGNDIEAHIRTRYHCVNTTRFPQ